MRINWKEEVLGIMLLLVLISFIWFIGELMFSN
jgi:hypothetical protein